MKTILLPILLLPAFLSGCVASQDELGNDSSGESTSLEAGAVTDCQLPGFITATPNPVGWASLNGGTKGGGNATPKVITTLAQFNAAAAGTEKAVLYVAADLGNGTAKIGSNKTILGCSGKGVLRGHVDVKNATNVIIRNLNIIGYNCAVPDVDTANGGKCEDGEDAVTVSNAKNVWFDHDAISDGTDGNLDINHASDFITVSNTKFFYSKARTDPHDTGAAGHRFSNTIGTSDSNGSEDSGKLNITWHGNWWGKNVVERQARVRFGKNHFFNNLWDSTTSNYCIRVGVSASILNESNAFIGVDTPVDTTSNSDSKSSAVSKNNLYVNTQGDAPADLNKTKVFSPQYVYSPLAASAVQNSVKANAGPK